MGFTLIDGKAVAQEVRLALKNEIDHALEKGIRPPGLAAILVGNDGASETYVASKVKACEQSGIYSKLIRFDENISEELLLKTVQDLNSDESIDGFIVQLPLPQHINEQKIIESILPEKDVDGFHPINVGKMALGLPSFVSATPKGVMMLLKAYNINTKGKNAVVIGRSHIVGMPMSLLLSQNNEPGNCTVTICHSKSKDIASQIKQADIIIAALGKPKFVTADMVKEGAVVIDVGITRIESEQLSKGYEIVGDVDFENVAPKCSYITPVPGGVGAMTIAALLSNTVQSWQQKNIHA